MSKMSNTEYRAVTKVFIGKGLSSTETTKKLDDIYDDSAPSYCTIVTWVAEFKNSIRAFEDAPRSGRPTVTLTDKSIGTVHKRSQCVINKFLFDA